MLSKLTCPNISSICMHACTFFICLILCTYIYTKSKISSSHPPPSIVKLLDLQIKTLCTCNLSTLVLMNIQMTVSENLNIIGHLENLINFKASKTYIYIHTYIHKIYINIFIFKMACMLWDTTTT